jgi:hypothetical protein
VSCVPASNRENVEEYLLEPITLTIRVNSCSSSVICLKSLSSEYIDLIDARLCCHLLPCFFFSCVYVNYSSQRLVPMSSLPYRNMLLKSTSSHFTFISVINRFNAYFIFSLHSQHLLVNHSMYSFLPFISLYLYLSLSLFNE